MKPLPTPTLEEAQLHAAKIGLSDLEAQKFHAYYESVGWRTKVGPLKNWHAAITGWKLRAGDFTTQRTLQRRPDRTPRDPRTPEQVAEFNEMMAKVERENPNAWTTR